tara:strand:- start:252 stop:2309 length:2058 start_codon:yes stop_codon:yes gene_type:complete
VIHTGSNQLIHNSQFLYSEWKLTEPQVPAGDGKKLYALAGHTQEDWNSIHSSLLDDGIECHDEKSHSPTKGVYYLTDAEAETLKEDSRVRYVHIDCSQYLGTFAPDPNDLVDSVSKTFRYGSNANQYRDWGGLLTGNSSDLNRASFQLYRCMQKDDPWVNNGNDNTIFTSRVEYYGDGSDVDVIVADESCWFGHSEFRRNAPNASNPTNYVGGNALDPSGTCDVLDLVLDAPYYIDPEWFNADAGNRLTTRWDGTTVPTESEAIAWWGTSGNRSVQFQDIGTVSVTSNYTRARCNGSDTAIHTNGGYHGTPCASLTYGRTHGWAFNSQKWFINAYGTYGSGTEQYLDITKLFHQNKPINSTYGNRNPTVSSNSFGYRGSVLSSGYYYYREGATGGTGVQYSSKPAFMNNTYQSSIRSEYAPNSMVTAGDEMITAGVVFVCSAGNTRQKLVKSTHPDYNNYWASTANTNLTSATRSVFGYTAYNTFNRQGFPGQIGATDDGQGNTIYPTIPVAALDDNISGGREQMAFYTNMGNLIPLFAPADETLAASGDTTPPTQYDRYDTTNSSLDKDQSFNGTSAACPVACGLIATKLQHNRSWDGFDVQNWLQNSVGIQSSTVFYYGPEADSATSSDWSDSRSIQGMDAVVIWDALTGGETDTGSATPKEETIKITPGSGITIRGCKLINT